MPQNSNFRLPRGHSFFLEKMEITVVAPNQSGDLLGYILGRMGSHWVQKMGQNRENLPCPKIWIFDHPAVIDFSKKNGSYGCGAKSRWGPPRVHLRANGVPLGPKMGQNRENLPCPQIRIFNYPAVIDFSKKKGSYSYGDKSRWGPLGSILGRMGSVKNYHAPKFEFSTIPRSSIFHKKWKSWLWCRIAVGTIYGPSSGQWGPIGSKKWIKTVKNYHAPKFEFLTTPR